MSGRLSQSCGRKEMIFTMATQVAASNILKVEMGSQPPVEICRLYFHGATMPLSVKFARRLLLVLFLSECTETVCVAQRCVRSSWTALWRVLRDLTRSRKQRVLTGFRYAKSTFLTPVRPRCVSTVLRFLQFSSCRE